MNALFTAAEVAAVTSGILLAGDPATPVFAFTNDSRQVRPGTCFVALQGEQADGHDYVPQAFAAGAAAALIKRPVGLAEPGLCLIQVQDPLLALGQLARYFYQKHPVPVAAVTGSVGKTTTKDLIAAVLSRRFRTLKTPGNFNSEIGLPLTLFQLENEHERAVLEMGMRGQGEITYLCSLVRPEIAVVTNVGISHVELLGSQEAIARAKAELVEGLAPGGTAVLNYDDPRVRAMARFAAGPVLFYGLEAPEAVAFTARDLRGAGDGGQSFTLVTPAGEIAVNLPTPGRHNVLNALAAAAVGLTWGLGLPEIAAGLGDYAPSGSRLRLISAGGVRILDDTYNAAPDSTVAALRTLRDLAGFGRAAAVLGSMFELGDAAVEGHLQVGQAAAALADHLFTVGDLAANISRGYDLARPAGGITAAHYAAKSELIDELLAWLRPGDTVLVKGSRGMHMEEIVTALENSLPRLP